jgi:hypothetical protein
MEMLHPDNAQQADSTAKNRVIWRDGLPESGKEDYSPQPPQFSQRIVSDYVRS